MQPMSIHDICAITQAKLIYGNPDTQLAHFIINSHEVTPGTKDTAFVAFKGETADGNTYALQALEAGAAAVALSSSAQDDLIAYAKAHGKAIIRVADDDPRAFLVRLARSVRKQHRWTVVGITGSNGKTTTKELLYAALKGTYRTYATPGNYNSDIGVPLALLEAPPNTQVFIVEMGMNNAAEIDRIASVARPHIAAITNVGSAHIGRLGSQENIARAKAECVAWLAHPLQADLSVEPALVLNAKDRWTSFIKQHFAKPYHVHTLEVGGVNDDITAKNAWLLGTGQAAFTLCDGPTSYDVALSLVGLQAIPDALIAYAIARHLGVQPPSIIAALEGYSSKNMRQSVTVSEHGVTLIDDTYNASPASYHYAFELLSAIAPYDNSHHSAPGLEHEGHQPQKIAVIGEMAELGDQARSLHKDVVEDALRHGFSHYCFVGPNFGMYMKEVASKCDPACEAVSFSDTKQGVLQYLRHVLRSGDVVLFKGSRFLKLNELVEEVASAC